MNTILNLLSDAEAARLIEAIFEKEFKSDIDAAVEARAKAYAQVEALEALARKPYDLEE